MAGREHSLAIEMSGAVGSVTLGRGGGIVGRAVLPDRQRGRHDVSLMPMIDGLCRQHGVRPGDLGEVYVSVGPGSFTGLRIAAATAKALAQVLGLRVVAVPSIDALARSGPLPEEGPGRRRHLLACLALKSGAAYAGLYEAAGGVWAPVGAPRLASLRDHVGGLRGPTIVLGDGAVRAAVERLGVGGVRNVVLAPVDRATISSDAVWRVGRERARRGRYDDPRLLKPLYARPPEAEVLWNQRHPTSSSSAGRTSASPAC